MVTIKIFNREVELRKLVAVSASTVIAFFRVAYHFKRPIEFISEYLSGNTYSKLVQLRNGIKIYLSSHVHDIITIFIIFGRKDYGSIKKDSIVVDIGGNIGVFALYAAINGASKVFVIEPNSASYNILQTNIVENGYTDKIILINKAVSDTCGQEVLIPVDSSPYNSIRDRVNDQAIEEGFESVQTINVEAVCEHYNISRIDLLKIDCEGAEFKIIPSLPKNILEKIHAIKVEYQGANVEIILSHLSENNFRVTKHQKDERMDGGMLWMEKI